MPDWPRIEGGGGLILAWQLKGRRVLIVGGGNVAADRIRSVLTADALVMVVCPRDGLGEEVKYRLFEQPELGIVYEDRVFDAEKDLDGPDGSPHMVLTAIDDPVASRDIWKLCKARRINVNVADVPPECDFYFGSVIKRGPLQVMVSTGGKGPRIANRIRRQIEALLPPNIGLAISNVGLLRSELRKLAPGHKDSPRRMQWMIRVSDKWDTDALAGMTSEQRERVLTGWADDVAFGPGDMPGNGLVKRWRLRWSQAKLYGACPLTARERSVVSAVGGAAIGAAIATAVCVRIWR